MPIFSCVAYLVTRGVSRPRGFGPRVSNLLEPFFKSLPMHILHWLQTALREEIAILEERWIPAKQFSHDEQLLIYGFTDLAIANLGQENIGSAFTADLP